MLDTRGDFKKSIELKYGFHENDQHIMGGISFGESNDILYSVKEYLLHYNQDQIDPFNIEILYESDKLNEYFNLEGNEFKYSFDIRNSKYLASFIGNKYLNNTSVTIAGTFEDGENIIGDEFKNLWTVQGIFHFPFSGKRDENIIGKGLNFGIGYGLGKFKVDTGTSYEDTTSTMLSASYGWKGKDEKLNIIGGNYSTLDNDTSNDVDQIDVVFSYSINDLYRLNFRNKEIDNDSVWDTKEGDRMQFSMVYDENYKLEYINNNDDDVSSKDLKGFRLGIVF
jgi:hypothetical protein